MPEAADIASKAPASSTATAPPRRSNSAHAASPPGMHRGDARAPRDRRQRDRSGELVRRRDDRRQLAERHAGDHADHGLIRAEAQLAEDRARVPRAQRQDERRAAVDHRLVVRGDRDRGVARRQLQRSARALRGESSTAGASSTPSHKPVTIAPAISPTPSDAVRVHGQANTRRGRAYSRTRRSKSSSASKSASSAWRKRSPLRVEQRHELVHQRRVELLARHAPHLRDRLGRGERRAVGVARDHHVVGVGDRDHPRQQRDRLAGELVRVALAVPALVVAEDDLRHRRVGLHPRDDAGAVLRVAADDLPVLLGQRRGGEQDRVGERELADVVQQPGGVDEVLLRARAAVRLGERPRVARDGGRVAGGHAVAHRQRVDHARERPELQRGELLGAPLRAQQLAQHVLEDEQDEREQRERRQPGLAVDDRHAHGQQRGRQLDRQHRDEDLAAPGGGSGCPSVRDVARRSSRS